MAQVTVILCLIFASLFLGNSHAFNIKMSEFYIYQDTICSVLDSTESKQKYSVYECSVQCMTGADCFSFTHHDGRCSFGVSYQQSTQAGAKCVLTMAG